MTKFSYTKLRSLERMERQSPELMNIGNDFYESAFGYINELEKRFEEERAENPSSKKLILISDELRNSRRIWKSIFERREKKVVQAALSAARSGSSPPKFLTDQEKIFYERLLKILQENRETIFEERKENKKLHVDNTVLRILKNVPPFVGSNMKKYHLKKEDVITMPKETAEILIKRGAAEEIKMNAV
ncbi:MAG: hypothetical protein U9O96_02540 [Candidatus Thermoplasmatota archaeon]|nr:hypothetical protein [Candidatus Thermoplasmatota archaeon]